MSITSVEINLANGGSHTASLSETLGDLACGFKQSAITSTIGEPIFSGNEDIDRLLKEFNVESKTQNRSPRKVGNDFKLIDKYSEIMAGTIILVRGLTASPFLEEEYDGFVYGASEMPLEFFQTRQAYDITHEKKTVGKHGTLTSSGSSKIFVLGSSYSAVSGKAWNFSTDPPEQTERYSQMYQKDELIESISFGNISLPTGADVDQRLFTAEDADVRYGYTAKEFFLAMKAAGVPVTGGGITEFTNSLFENSGTMMECLSNIATFYGYYWYIDIYGSTKGVKLIKSTDAHKLLVKNPSTIIDTSIMSYTYTESNNSVYNVLSFNGDTESVKNDIGGDTTFSNDKPRYFKPLFLDTVVASVIDGGSFGEFLWFFNSVDKDNGEIFNKLFFLGYQGGDILDKYFPWIKGANKYYDSEIEKLSVGPISLGLKEDEFQKLTSGKIEYAQGKCYSVTSGGKDGVVAKMPNEMPIYSILKSYFDCYGKIFISNGCSKVFTLRNYFVAGDSSSVSGPNRGNIKIKEIDSLKPLSDFLEALGYNDKTMGDIARLAKAKPLVGGSTDEDNYYFVGIRSETSYSFDKTKKNGKPANQHQLPDYDKLRAANYLLDGGPRSYLIASNTSATGVSEHLKNSRIAFDTINNEFTTTKTTLKTFLKKITDDDFSFERDEPEDLKFDRKFFSIKRLGSSELMGKASLASFSGNTIEVKALADANLSDIGINLEGVSSSSITYAGLVSPTSQSILTDSISISKTSNGYETTISESTKLYLPIDQKLITDKSSVYQIKNPRFSAGARNFFKLS